MNQLDYSYKGQDLTQHKETKKSKTALKRGLAPFLKPLKESLFEIFFSDEMRYGLISNFRRSWSKIGKRTIIDSQQSYENRYLFSAVSPLSGNSFHLSGIDGFDTEAAHTFLLELKKQHKDKMVIVVWDNAPCHRPKIHRDIPGTNYPFSPSIFAGTKSA